MHCLNKIDALFFSSIERGLFALKTDDEREREREEKEKSKSKSKSKKKTPAFFSSPPGKASASTR